jgi:transposase InsO family protein
MDCTTPVEKFKLIHATISNDKNLLKISWLCEEAGVSRSGYYAWIDRKDQHNAREANDKIDFDLILEAYKHRGYDKGSRGIQMRLLHTGIVMNRKKVQRLMRKFNLFCPIRKPNPYRRMAKALKTDVVAPNIVNREFDKHGPGKILLTDITYLREVTGRFYYLCVLRDGCTKQVLAYQTSDSLTVDFILEMMRDLKKNHEENLDPNAIIHSDQGCHFTSVAFRDFFKKDTQAEVTGWIQSMSRRGNCWDNAPVESFFGHMKDQISEKLKSCESLDDVKRLIDDYMDYYNNERHQWNLAKLAPNQYAHYLKTGIHPLDALSSGQELK